MKKRTFFAFVNGLFLAFGMGANVASAQDDTMMQAFYWDVPVDEIKRNGTWWENLENRADDMKSAGITAIWIPSPAKGNFGIRDMGYGIYDHYDLGNYNQKGTVETRFGSRAELEAMLAEMHDTEDGKRKINVYADIVLNHIYAADDADENNPVVKDYVFCEAIVGGNQLTPYPTNGVRWVIRNALAGDYFIRVKGYHMGMSANSWEREQAAYTISMGDGRTWGYEFEPNNGNGQNNSVSPNGGTVQAHIDYEGDIDEYKLAMTDSGDIVMKFSAVNRSNGEWKDSDQTKGYYPFEIWYLKDGKSENITPTAQLEAHTNTGISYVSHTGTGEKNYTWSYRDFHPSDDNDWLGDGGGDGLIPNTMMFGNDLNTFSAEVQQRMNDWGVFLTEQLGFNGYRLDFVRGFQKEYVASWVKSLPQLDGKQRCIVGEYWTDKKGILRDWVNGVSQLGADVDVFDFPLKFELNRLCNGGDSYDMRWLNHAGLVRDGDGNNLPGVSVVTFLDNHDTGKECDKWIHRDWKMGYAYILTHEGRPCVFYPHFYATDLVNHGDHSITTHIPDDLQTDIRKLIFVRRTYLGGVIAVLSEIGSPYPAEEVRHMYVARRQGNGTKDGAIVVINNASAEKSLWVDSTPEGWSDWRGRILIDAFDPTKQVRIEDDGRVNVSAPARGYAVYVLADDYVARP